MNKDNFHIDSNGYVMSLTDQIFVKQVTSRLLDTAPYRSYLKVLLCRSGNSFEGLFNLNSLAIRLEVYQKSQTFKQTFEGAILKLHRQIKKWKTTRFKEDVYIAQLSQPLVRSSKLKIAS